jgi:hypothetical protein
MQFSDFSRAGGGLMDTVQMVFFRMLPRRAQIEKVRAEINRSLLKPYGKITRLEIDQASKIIRAELELKGETEVVRITVSNYRLIQEAGKNPLFEPGAIEASREWLDALLKILAARKSWPERMEIKNPLHQTVLKAIL